MKVTIGTHKGFEGDQAWFTIHNQTFFLQPVESPELAQWYAKNLKIAIEKLDVKVKKTKKSPYDL
ncbi:hypothetical protein [Aquimarina algiphila]|uniref:Uncharacterized protein n=1 Tax=Aquimarina algiphila TaxID=2047982 RepID=A0A554VRM3_9FLAO|nr:hypothetical protein [Aquimarina algiphila]TSE11314.1 hypothetical protein FOF46_01405 [Aquimarina algiphila]